ncbi:hypothetical protein [Pseudarthrobacter sp. NamB4]|uniref:hypothetical protein n=1 Tax=Pseudarthrobacter sp. NamB4 TaxID=2576837 RepID=UPI0010FCEB39|nr:hypothetical protein [Pseudarthrobacter sp. NamB4]TLM72422.1 hypothetical protein FDW81_12905 [Pseudarthrobacter sp. NamB4]
MTSKSAPPAAPLDDQAPKKRNSVFVVSPIGAPGTEAHRKASYALKYIFREALKGDEWDVHRADEGESPDSIGQHVIRKLWEADLVIADLTGHNPNVFYELAIAHGWRKPVVHLIAKGETIPFDIVDQRTIFYDITDLASVEATVEILRKYAEYAMAHTEELITPLSSFEKFSHIRADDSDGGVAVAEVLEEVVSRLSRLEHTITRQSGTHVFHGDGAPSTWFPPGSGKTAELVEEYAKLLNIVNMVEAEDSMTETSKAVKDEVQRRMDALLKPYPKVMKHQLHRRAEELLADGFAEQKS